MKTSYPEMLLVLTLLISQIEMSHSQEQRVVVYSVVMSHSQELKVVVYSVVMLNSQELKVVVYSVVMSILGFQDPEMVDRKVVDRSLP